jgi:mRNA-degrading endonuclease RelE of RelBE toxin-antitoxin system
MLERVGACLMYQIIIKKKAKRFIDKLPVNERDIYKRYKKEGDVKW